MALERNVARIQLPMRALAYHPDGKNLAVGGDVENVQIRALRDGEVGKPRPQVKHGRMCNLSWLAGPCRSSET